MDGFIAVITVVLVVAYLAFAIYSIIESDTTGKRVGLTVAFAAGGCVSVTVASFSSSFILGCCGGGYFSNCWFYLFNLWLKR